MLHGLVQYGATPKERCAVRVNKKAMLTKIQNVLSLSKLFKKIKKAAVCQRLFLHCYRKRQTICASYGIPNSGYFLALLVSTNREMTPFLIQTCSMASTPSSLMANFLARAF